MAGRVRRFFERNLREESPSVLVLIMSLAWEIFQPQNGNISSVRSLFERAVESLKVCVSMFIHVYLSVCIYQFCF